MCNDKNAKIEHTETSLTVRMNKSYTPQYLYRIDGLRGKLKMQKEQHHLAKLFRLPCIRHCARCMLLHTRILFIILDFCGLFSTSVSIRSQSRYILMCIKRHYCLISCVAPFLAVLVHILPLRRLELQLSQRKSAQTAH